MSGLVKKILFIVIPLTFIYGCDKDDDFVYPDLYREFVTFKTDANGTVSDFTNDAGSSWSISPVKGLMNLTADSTYRVVARYVPDTPEKNMAQLYGSEGVIAPVPIKMAQTNINTDPVKIQSLFRGGDYINMVLNVLVKDKAHKYHFIQTSVEEINDGMNRKVTFLLYHDNNDDVPAFYRTVYCSIPLWPYKQVLTNGDEIEVDINTYDDGVVKRVFNY